MCQNLNIYASQKNNAGLVSGRINSLCCLKNNALALFLCHLLCSCYFLVCYPFLCKCYFLTVAFSCIKSLWWVHILCWWLKSICHMQFEIFTKTEMEINFWKWRSLIVLFLSIYHVCRYVFFQLVNITTGKWS